MLLLSSPRHFYAYNKGENEYISKDVYIKTILLCVKGVKTIIDYKKKDYKDVKSQKGTEMKVQIDANDNTKAIKFY